MAIERHIRRLLTAAIVLIAAYLVPSLASAHEGHAVRGFHHGHQIERNQAAEFATAMAVPRVLVLSVMMASASNDAACCPACAGCSLIGCCGGAAILSASATLPQRIGHAVGLHSSEVPMPPGIGPVALREPPRSHA